MPSAAALIRAFPAKLVAKVTQPVPAKSLLDAPDERRLEKTECLLRVLAALAAGEEPDAQDVPEFREFAADEGFTKYHLQFAVEALKSIGGNLNCWPAEFAERLAACEADEKKWQLAEQEADLALTRARRLRRAAQHDRETLVAEDRQVRHFIAANPLLCGSLELASKSVTVVPLTRNECAGVIASPYQAFELDKLRTLKMHYAKEDAKQAASK